MSDPSGFVSLLVPLGAGRHFVGLNGIAFEAMMAPLEHRRRSDLRHFALEIRAPPTENS